MYEWKVGELAVCVIGHPGTIQAGQIFPVKEVLVDPFAVDTSPWVPINDTQLKLHGPVPPNGQPWWKSTRFRPLNEDDYKRIREKHGMNDKVDRAMREFKFGPVRTEIGRWK